MPVAFDPSARRRFCLHDDVEQNRPEEQRVYFLARYLTYEEMLRHAEIYSQLGPGMTNAQAEQVLHKLYGIGLIGPVDAKDPRTGEPLPCSLESIPRLLSPFEMWALAREYPYPLTGEDEKKFASLLPSRLASSVKSAATADASTSPAQPSESSSATGDAPSAAAQTPSDSDAMPATAPEMKP